MQNRLSKIVGHGVNRGSLNPKIYVENEEPLIAKRKDIWIKTSATIGIYVYGDWGGSGVLSWGKVASL